ncbi:hypothetical protein [Glycomyces sp. NPDC048151]|uniref:hypothetical protein n=1 Tax=Glycomyces sp. NPDC048151 TaxID=3364002 RepID=UPI003718ACC8
MDDRLRALAERAQMREREPARVDWAAVAAETDAMPPPLRGPRGARGAAFARIGLIGWILLTGRSDLS